MMLHCNIYAQVFLNNKANIRFHILHLEEIRLDGERKLMAFSC